MTKNIVLQRHTVCETILLLFRRHNHLYRLTMRCVLFNTGFGLIYNSYIYPPFFSSASRLHTVRVLVQDFRFLYLCKVFYRKMYYY
jgi:hypothetical protein